MNIRNMRKRNRDSNAHHFFRLIGSKTILYTISFFLLSWLLALNTAISAENPTSPVATSNTRSFKLNKLIKVETVVMQGNRPSFNFYIPIPKNWQVNNLDLNLIFQHSPLLENTSTLTLSVGDVPIDSIFLTKDKQQPIHWNVTIPKEYISPKVTTINLNGWFKIGDKICQDTENKGNWVAISGNSDIVYHYMKSDWTPALVNFPQPFIHLDAPYKDVVTLLLPNRLTDTSFFPYFDFANILAQKASWRGVSFDLIHVNELGQKTLSHPAVLAATADNVDFTAIGQPGLLRLKNRQWVNLDGTVLPENSGFIWLTQYQQQPLLVISSNSTEGLNNTIRTLRSGLMQKMVNNPSFFLVKNKIDLPDNLENRSSITFQDLGYKDNMVFGVGQNALSYQFNLPTQFFGKNNSLNLVYSHSPFLEKIKLSSLSVNLNGVPIGGVELVPDSEGIKTLKLPLPANNLVVGKNNLTINFVLSLASSWCSKDYLAQAWGIIYQNSNLEFSSEDEDILDRPQLKDWPSLMTGNVFVSLPSEEEAYNNKKLINNLINFSSNLKNNTSLALLNHSKFEKSKIASYNTLLFTTAKSHSLFIEDLKKLFKNFLVSLKNTKDPVLTDIDKSVFENAFLESQGIGFARIWEKETDPNTHQMILYGYSPADLNLAVRLLDNGFKRESLSGNLAVSFENGSFTSLSPEDIQSQTESEATMKKVTQITSHLVLYVLATFLALIIIGLILRIFRKKSGD
ncbi:cellulose synthase regulator protein [Legionella gratiana]|uniref:Cyclic di-GMP-binding protein n=1 Tax=Legionella gratiana TaxID=45066 RepID=A0A378JAQ8_9GAMM|nr:cellulose biosynthesis cyclic di-GMP-binding regulatory protein BcsB [Legionella gratiana]KTD14629.1 cellulose synthase regulator protein [Legionella gratiana]STX41670.1 cellulose synthase regulator protein [Legionella gratiana]